jgi:Kef-type K+ transport system membrane component KefB
MPPTSPLYTTVLLLGCGVIGLTASKAIRISPIIGFFIVGALVGSRGFGLIHTESESLHTLGDVGVCFLLFDIGLHFSLAELGSRWRQILLAGLFQFTLVSIAIAFLMWCFGFAGDTALLLGAISSLSSTALVLNVLSEERDLLSPTGRSTTELLVFQDLIAILLLVLLSSSRSGGQLPWNLVGPLVKIAVAAPIVVIAGRFALRPVFRTLVALKSNEAFTAVALLIVLLTSLATDSLGLSLALGAFLGGLALSESSYSFLVKSELAPFRSLLLSLFFMTVGMSFDLRKTFTHLDLVVFSLTLLVLLKMLMTIVALRIAGMPQSSAVRIGIIVSQGSEFAFVLLAAAADGLLISQLTVDTSIAVIALSLVLTPLLSRMSCMLSRGACNVRTDEVEQEELCDVVIVEFDEYARNLAALLIEAGIKYRGHDHDYDRLTHAKSRGFTVYFSDPDRPRTLSLASIGRVRMVVSLVENDEIIAYLVQGVRKIVPSMPIMGASWEPRRLEVLIKYGIQDPLLKSDTSVLVAFEEIMQTMQWDQKRITDALATAKYYLQAQGDFPRPPESSVAIMK